MARFKLLNGQHIQVDPASPALTLEQVKAGARRFSRIYNVGEIVESDVDLVKKHGADRFETVPAETSGGQVSTSLQEGGSVVRDNVANTKKGVAKVDDGLENMTMAQLKAIFDQDGLNYQEARNKEGAIRIIRASRSSD